MSAHPDVEPSVGGSERPGLSVVVTIVDGGDVLRRFLTGLERQQDGPSLEVLVPFDATIPETAELASEFPRFRFLDLGELATERPIDTAAGQHELYDRRRAAGLAASTGELVGILEDRGVPRPDWARNVVEEHRSRHSVVGGAIEPAPGGDLLRWAFYVCDFDIYGLPFRSRPAEWVSDINVIYKREALESTREIWRERYREPLVHWALMERGDTLLLSNRVVVDYLRSPISIWRLIPERFHWGRLFGHIRSLRSGTGKRLVWAAAGPLIPFRLFFRHALIQRRQGRLGRYLLAAPLVAIMVTAWTTGEIAGYITNRV